MAVQQNQVARAPRVPLIRAVALGKAGIAFLIRIHYAALSWPDTELDTAERFSRPEFTGCIVRSDQCDAGFLS